MCLFFLGSFFFEAKLELYLFFFCYQLRQNASLQDVGVDQQALEVLQEGICIQYASERPDLNVIYDKMNQTRYSRLKLWLTKRPESLLEQYPVLKDFTQVCARNKMI